MAATKTREPVPSQEATASAVVWINGRGANVVAMGGDGRISSCEITRGWLAEGPYLAQVVRAIGDRRRVVILGPSTARLALEREYVALFRRPDRLVDVERSGPQSSEDLIGRLRTLAA